MGKFCVGARTLGWCKFPNGLSHSAESWYCLRLGVQLWLHSGLSVLCHVTLQLLGLLHSMVASFQKGTFWDFPSSPVVKNLSSNARDMGSIPGFGRSPGEEKGYPLQYSGLENSMVSIVHGITKSRTRLSNFHFTSMGGSQYLPLESGAKAWSWKCTWKE